MSEQYPWDSKNKYTFYAIIWMEEEADGLNYDSMMTSKMTAFSTNEWLFRQYLRAYQRSFEALPYALTEYPNMTYDEFKNNVRCDFGIEITNDNCISQAEFPLLDGCTVYYTGEMLEDMIDYQNDCGDFLTSNIEWFYSTFDLVSGEYSKYLKTSRFSCLNKLLKKICNVYVPLIEMHDFGDEYAGEWFLSLPDRVKSAITMEANFPKVIEDIGYYDLYDEYYGLYFYLYEVLEIDDLVK